MIMEENISQETLCVHVSSQLVADSPQSIVTPVAPVSSYPIGLPERHSSTDISLNALAKYPLYFS